jgi:ribose/xylose/arabinose/galactoside ABC-type transport system permease subunit
MTNKDSQRSQSLAALLFRGRLPLVIGGLLLFMALYDRSFFIPENLLNIVSYSSINGLLAIGMTMLMISREFDISVGSNLVLSGVVGVQAANHFGPATGLVLGVASGAVMGLINGWLVAKANVNSFIATLGSMVIFQGIAFALTDMKPVACDLMGFHTLGSGEWLGLPSPVLCFAGMTALIWFFLKFTRVGKNAYAIGGNLRGCRNLGIAVDRWRIGYFVICGVCASFAGVILASKLGAASATFGENVALVVIAAIVLGGVPLTGGAGSVPGVVGAILLLGLIDSMTIYLNVFGYYQKLFWAVLLIGVVVLDVLYARRDNRRLEFVGLLQLKRESQTPAPAEVKA